MRVTDVSCVLVVFGRVALARMVSASLVQVKGPGNQGYINWVRPGDCGKGCSAHVPLVRRRGAGALTTNWAGNFHRALGCADAAASFSLDPPVILLAAVNRRLVWGERCRGRACYP